jgi:hypothetical protein
MAAEPAPLGIDCHASQAIPVKAGRTHRLARAFARLLALGFSLALWALIVKIAKIFAH